MSDSDSERRALRPRGATRIDVETKVNMEFERFSGFISEFSKNVSEGGMFVRSDTPHEVGSVFSFEFRLKDDIKLIQGWGEVVWVRVADESTADRPAGMGIRFIDLDEESRNLIRRIVNTESKLVADDNSVDGGFDPFADMMDESSGAPQPTDESDVEVEEIDLSGLPAPEVSNVVADPQPSAPEAAPASNNFENIIQSIEESAADADNDSIMEEVEVHEVSGAESDMTGVNQARRSKLPMIVGGLLVCVLVGGFFMRDQLTEQVRGLLYTVGLMSPEVPYTPPAVQVPVVPPPTGSVPAPEVGRDRVQPADGSKPNQMVAQAPATPQPQTAPREAAVAEPTLELPAEPVAVVPVQKEESAPVAVAEPMIGKPARTLRDIEMIGETPGQVTLRFLLDGDVSDGQLELFQTKQPPPRLVLKIPGVQSMQTVNRVPLNAGAVRRLRLGLHNNPAALHIVFDLDGGFKGRYTKRVESKAIIVTVSP